MGDPNVGKSCLIKRYCEGRFISEYISTIGIDYGVKTIQMDEVEVKVNFWDIAGDSVYFEIRNEFYKDTHGVILVYDTSIKETFTNLQSWIDELNTYCQSETISFLVANKVDQAPRAVTRKEGESLAEQLGLRYFETSALTGEGVQSMFTALFADVLKMLEGQQEQRDSKGSKNEG
ncbi:hypothetical protein SpCBS45565_g06744 [Spizellomyces sp. 'palustris']|nr:hypothetical protein SpCBS45565_g06744 [Spizellomyces sp. 'palustris']